MKILFGLYNKYNEDDRLWLEKLICPPGSMSYELENDVYGLSVEVKRSHFPKENTYHGWYALIPKDLNLFGLLENSISYIKPEDVKKDVEIIVDGIIYNVYAHFGVAKSSNNWKLKLTFRE